MAGSVDFDLTVLVAAMDAFGEPATYIPGSGPPVETTGIFDERFRVIKQSDDAAPVLTYRPLLGCRRSQLPQKPSKDEMFIVSGRHWVVSEVEDDGLGHLAIFLHKVP